MSANLTDQQFESLRCLDACTLANAIETFRERLRNEGFMNNSVRALFPQFPPMLGYAATLKVRGSAPPMADGRFSERTDWWDYVSSLPAPRVLVLQDAATRVGLGSLLGAVQFNILHALGCVGAVTNGSVRDLPAAERLGFPLFAGNIAVSHAYVHVVEFGSPVEIGGLKIASGDLIHGDLHGVQSVPLEIAPRIPGIAAMIHSREKALIELCQSREFSIEKLRAAVTDKAS